MIKLLEHLFAKLPNMTRIFRFLVWFNLLIMYVSCLMYSGAVLKNPQPTAKEIVAKFKQKN